MERLRLILVETEGPINLGMIARLAENFSVEELYLVNPKASIEEAREYAVKAAHRLDNAIIVDSLEKALQGAHISICTSAKTGGRNILREPVSVWEAAEIAVKTPGTIALVMGRESVGLTRNEIKMCNLLAHIPASPRYPVLNLANATAIFLYELYKSRTSSSIESFNAPREKTLRLLHAYTMALSEILVHDERRRDEVVKAIERIAVKSVSRKREIEMLLYLLSKACRRLEGCEEKISGNL